MHKWQACMMLPGSSSTSCQRAPFTRRLTPIAAEHRCTPWLQIRRPLIGSSLVRSSRTYYQRRSSRIKAQDDAAVEATHEPTTSLAATAAAPSHQDGLPAGEQQHEAGETAAAPTPIPQQHQPQGLLQSLASTITEVKATVDEVNAEAEAGGPSTSYAQVEPLPVKNYGTLWGGSYPFMYDPVYGLPIVRDVAKYSEVLRDIRLGKVDQVLWFFDPARTDPFYTDGRCLIRYTDGSVKQSSIPSSDPRIAYAMDVHGVSSTKIPLEPRHVVEYAAADDARMHPLQRWYKEHVDYYEALEGSERRGPRIGPTPVEGLRAEEAQASRDTIIDWYQQEVQAGLQAAQRMPSEDWEALQGARGARAGAADEGRYDSAAKAAAALAQSQSWSDRISISQDTQAFIYKYIPIIGPIFGSAFIVGLYLLARLLRGDLTDRLKMMDEAEQKRQRTAKKEARIAFLEEELPSLVAKGASFDQLKARSAKINEKLGEKFEIGEAELQATYDACINLIGQGADIAAGDTSASGRILAEADAEAAAADAAGEKSELDAAMDMGKLNTARVRKAIDPKILEVKKRVRQARRSLKRESKVQLSDEIIFFDDVAGNEQAKVELMEVVDFFKQPEKFKASGAKPPKGVLLVGPPGNGKTLMARAVAGESGVAFISSSASEFIEMYMGLGAARVRDLFNTARKLAPCIIFIDELDAVGRARRSGGQSNDERDNTVNQLLTEMDGFEAESAGIVVMGATNRKDVLDAALTRPGRFDRSIEVRRPDFAGRMEACQVHLREKPLGEDIDFKKLGTLTGGMSGAQIAGMCNLASFIASRDGRSEVVMEDLVKAVEQSKYGRAYELNKFVSPTRKKRFAVMEGSISLVATLMPALEPVQYVTISPSIKSPIGRTVLTPSYARFTTGVWTRRYLEEQLLMALAGRAGEELMFGRDELSSLNQHRLQLARQIVHKLMNAGFSEHPDFENIRALGAARTDPSSEPGRWQTTYVQTDWTQSRSEWVDVDMEMERRLNEAYDKVKALLQRNRACLEQLVELLLQQEQVQGEQVRALVEAHAHPQDLQVRAQAQQAALL